MVARFTFTIPFWFFHHYQGSHIQAISLHYTVVIYLFILMKSSSSSCSTHSMQGFGHFFVLERLVKALQPLFSEIHLFIHIFYLSSSITRVCAHYWIPGQKEIVLIVNSQCSSCAEMKNEGSTLTCVFK